MKAAESLRQTEMFSQCDIFQEIFQNFVQKNLH